MALTLSLIKIMPIASMSPSVLTWLFPTLSFPSGHGLNLGALPKQGTEWGGSILNVCPSIITMSISLYLYSYTPLSSAAC